LLSPKSDTKEIKLTKEDHILKTTKKKKVKKEKVKKKKEKI
jgi:hypothetical protein